MKALPAADGDDGHRDDAADAAAAVRGAFDAAINAFGQVGVFVSELF